MNTEIANRFSSHLCDEDGINKMRSIRRKVRSLASLIETLCPYSKEKSTALTQLSFVMMSANSAISQAYPIDPKETCFFEKLE